MKKMIAVLVCLTLFVTSCIVFAACSKQETKKGKRAGSEINEGWRKADSPKITKTVEALFERAMKGMDGVTFTPVAYIAFQTVSGTNHLVLCKTAPVVPDANATYALVTLYESLNGEAEIVDIKASKANATHEEEITGDFVPVDSPIVTEEAKKALEKAYEGLTGVEYSPVALIAKQIGTGTNYLILCERTVVVPDAEGEYVMVSVGSQSGGSAEILEIYEFEAKE